MDYEKTGRFLQELRKENGLTQLALAESKRPMTGRVATLQQFPS